LHLYKFNIELFDLLKGSDYEALKKDIKKNGVKVELHILPDKTVICGHQRLKIAKELKIDHLRCKTVYNLDTEQQIKEYVILDNLLRRQLTPEKKAFLLNELSKQYEIGRRGRTKEERIENANSASSNGDVLDKTAKIANVSSRTVANARAYAKAVKQNPDKYKGKKISKVLNEVQKEKKAENGKNRIFAEISVSPPDSLQTENLWNFTKNRAFTNVLFIWMPSAPNSNDTLCHGSSIIHSFKK
jgi:ParB-like chromosome segregation protein Spo0J